jgi:hypothetical protein
MTPSFVYAPPSNEFADGIALRFPSSTRLALLAYSVRSTKRGLKAKVR